MTWTGGGGTTSWHAAANWDLIRGDPDARQKLARLNRRVMLD
jgi:hypothetical protein